ncbi:uncharacterized protein LOC126725413 [Quercus robur]|uniref:uncharacterized protein LOC126725413 n=1 Tax=Quercus robur TaxID=38942 RepID=UPI002162CA29|nr:uncharacterized protein LOC126725413 [Quercus robur]
MDSAKQRIRAAAARQKEERKAKEAGGEASSTPTAVAKVAKRKPDGSDGRPSKKPAVTPSVEPLKEKSPPTSGHGAGKGVMTSAGPVTEGPCRLLTHKEYAVGEVESLIKPTDMEPCDQVGTEDLGASALFDLSRALVRVKALRDRCVAKEGVVSRVRSHNKNLLNQQAQYKEAVRILNQELQDVNTKLTAANGENVKLQGEVTALEERLQTAGADAIRDFKTSQAFIDSCGQYYGTGFDDCLRQVASAFPDLDLSRITMDDGDDVSLQPEPTPEHDGSVVLAQPAANPTASDSPAVIVDVEDRLADGNPADVPAA